MAIGINLSRCVIRRNSLSLFHFSLFLSLSRHLPGHPRTGVGLENLVAIIHKRSFLPPLQESVERVGFPQWLRWTYSVPCLIAPSRIQGHL